MKPIAQAVLLAAVAGQDLDLSGEVFRIARRIAPDRVISTVDPEARDGHQTAGQGSTVTRVALRSTQTAKSAPLPRPPRPTRSRISSTTRLPPYGDDADDADEADQAERPKVYGDQAYGTGVPRWFEAGPNP